jgi:glutamate carboxypeptidase
MDRESPPAAVLSADELGRLGLLVQQSLPAYLEDLATLVNIDCGSYTKAGVDRVGRWTALFLERLGARVTVHPNATLGDTIVGRIPGGRGGDPAARGNGSAGSDVGREADPRPRILLIGHMDTVFPDGTAAERPYRTEGGRAFGPGVTDMKSGLLAGLYAILALRGLLDGGRATSSGGTWGSWSSAGTTVWKADAAWPPFASLTFVANPDEEIGSPASTPIIRELARDADACFVLECARANGDIVSARKGTVDLRITVTGRAAHAGVEPEKGRSAILEAAHLIQALHALNGRWPGVTCNVGVVHGGTRPNVVAESATLEVDLRAIGRADLEAAEAAIAELAARPTVPDVTVRVEEMNRHWPMERLERSGRLVDTAREIGERLGFEVPDAATGGASDANTTAGMGVPTLDGLGPIGGNDHAPAEYLELDSIVPRTTLLAALLLAVSRDAVVAGWRQGGRESGGPKPGPEGAA